MGIDLVGLIDATTRSWPKCDRCSKRLQRDYPVESFGIEGIEKSAELRMRGKVVLVAECHGDRAYADVDIPAWFTEAKVHRLFGALRFFQHGGVKASHNCIVRI
jgi:hypothetical protein